LTGENLPVMTGLIETDRPDVVLLSSGTADHGPLAAALWQAGIAHLSACAYPQARFFEVSLILPAEHTPCLHCFRGHLYRGRESAPPMNDDLARFLYQTVDPAERERLYRDLVAEPASGIETGRIALVAAQALVEVLRPPSTRGAWAQRLLAEGTTCLLGGNLVELGADGEPAYGLTYPGQVVRLGLGDVIGAEHQRTCQVCGRRLRVDHPLELPQVPGEDADRALLG
jgi:hypothetical protein